MKILGLSASYYPNLAIANHLAPAHLGDTFSQVYKDLYETRKSFPKGSPENAMFKLALNGVYGKSNSVYSCFYDPQYTMAITVNGQLLLCMLAEQMVKVPDLRMIQVNTDGLTVYCRRRHLDHIRALWKWWESVTNLVLEENLYKSMIIRDVNNYIAVYESGKVKRKGAYAHSDDLGWHQDHSSQVVQKVAEQYLLHGGNIWQMVREHQDLYDFMICAKVKGKDRLQLGDQELQKTNRVYVSTDGQGLTKHMRPTAGQLKKDPNAPERVQAVMSGWLVTEANDITRARWENIDYQYYVAEVQKLVNGVTKRATI